MAREKARNFIAGAFADAVEGGWGDVWAPATGRAYTQFADSGAKDVDLAVAAAREAFPAWAATPARERARYLRRIAEILREKQEAFVLAESVDSGKPATVAKAVDIPRAGQNFEFFADAATQFSSEAHATDDRYVNYTLRQPLGPVACISPWNLPLYLLTWKIAPALASGNTVVAKPSEVTPVTAYMLAQVAREAKLPGGVLNIVQGRGATAGAALCSHPDIKAISFTGSTRTGAEIARVAAPQFKKLSLELGGKNATLVFADCDFERTVEEVARSAFSNQGQICLCGSRILVERSIYDRFRDALVERVKRLKVGDPLEVATDVGALVSKEHFEKVLSYVELARSEGGKVLTGGNAVRVEGRCADGWFVAPTLVEGLAPSCRTNQEEIFGPVATLIPFADEAEALAIANSTRYGLAASVWTRDVTRVQRVTRGLEAGIVWVNCWMVRDLRTPFGGVKESGVGREGGLEAMRFFTEPKNVCIWGGQS